MRDREYEKEEALWSLAINHQRTFSGTPSCNEFTSVARSNMEALLSLCMAASRTTTAVYNRAARRQAGPEWTTMLPKRHRKQLWLLLLIYGQSSKINRYGTMQPTAYDGHGMA
uniref:Uncharacterized protein n=1 Tax=Schizaphis graminum TaxID=13262 RepID=A0A2S2NSK2_SCHGA